MQVINLYGGPGTGKSTVMAELFARLKWAGSNVEMASEFAKDLVWEKRFHTLNDQIYIFGKQNHRIQRLEDQVDYVITDSPLLLSLYYNKGRGNHFDSLVTEVYQSYRNIDIFLTREKNYSPLGRMQTEEEAIAIDGELLKILGDNSERYYTVPANHDAVNQIMTILSTYSQTCRYCNGKASHHVSMEFCSEDVLANIDDYCCTACLEKIIDLENYDNIQVEAYPPEVVAS
jgi:hypothetical protein